jgi:hypothetical protein
MLQFHPVSDRAEILLELMEKEIGGSGQKGHVAWVASGLKIQEIQYDFPAAFLARFLIIIAQTTKVRLSLQALVRKIGFHPTPDQQRDITLKRAQLQDRVDAFQKQAANFIHAVSDSGDDSWEDTSAREVDIGVEFDGIDEDEDDECTPSASEHRQMQLSENGPTNSSIDAEHILLHLPSNLGRNWCNTNAAEDLAKAELCLRQGQLNDTLHHIRIALGHKSYLFRKDIRPARTQRLKTRAWAEVHAAESTVQHHARVYMRSQQAIVDLGASPSLLDRYKVLTCDRT